MKKILNMSAIALAASLISGCHWVTLTKNQEAWHASELSLLSDSTLANLVCTVNTNGFALEIGSIVTGVSSNAAPVITSTGSAVGSIVGTAVHTSVTGE